MRSARVPVGATLLFLMTLSAPLAAAQGTTDSSELFPNACRDVLASDAIAHGMANPLTVILNGEEAEPLIDTDVAEATQVGPGKAGDRTAFVDVSVPDEDDPIVTAQLVAGRVDLDVDNATEGYEAEAWSQAKLAHLNVLDGLVTADLVRGFAYARTDVRSARTETDPSTIVGLQVAGVSYTDVAPGANITLPPLVGAGSYVSVYERIDHSLPPTVESPLYVADVRVKMINIHITKAPLLGAVDVIVSEAYARAQSPTPFCGVAQTVEAGAYTARVRSGLEEPGILIGEQHIGVMGGSGHQQLFGENVDVGVQALVNVTETDVTGNITAGVSSDSHAMSQVVGLCIKLDDTSPDCFIKATVVKAEATAHADADGAVCTGDVVILELVVDGTDVIAALNQDGLNHPTVAGDDPTYSVGPIGIWINQQERMDSDGYCSLYVRAIRIETGLPFVGTVIVGRAYVSAAFEHAGTPETDPWHE